MVGDVPYEDIGRRRPAQGVHIHLGQPAIVFLTACTRGRQEWLAQPSIHEIIRAAWQSAEAWQIGFYILMPDHLHLFCAPRDLQFTVERWCAYWQSQLSKAHNHPAWRIQPHPFHHRLRRSESYSEKWNYVRMNPVRKGLVARSEDWPYQGMLTELWW